MTVLDRRPSAAARLPWSSSIPTLAELIGDRDDWRTDGACVGADSALFDPSGENERVRGYPPRAVEAARYCRGCPVIEQCRAWADKQRETGVWAGAWRTNSHGYARTRIPTERTPKKTRTP